MLCQGNKIQGQSILLTLCWWLVLIKLAQIQTKRSFPWTGNSLSLPGLRWHRNSKYSCTKETLCLWFCTGCFATQAKRLLEKFLLSLKWEFMVEKYPSQLSLVLCLRESLCVPFLRSWCKIIATFWNGKKERIQNAKFVEVQMNTQRPKEDSARLSARMGGWFHILVHFFKIKTFVIQKHAQNTCRVPDLHTPKHTGTFLSQNEVEKNNS